MKAGLRRTIAEDHTVNGVVSIIGEVFQFIGNGDVKQLRMVEQDAEQVISGRRPRNQGRVQAAELAVAGSGGGDNGQGPKSPCGREIYGGLGREIGSPLGLIQSGRKSRSCVVVWDTKVHQIAGLEISERKTRRIFGWKSINGGLANTETLWIGLSGKEKRDKVAGWVREIYGVL